MDLVEEGRALACQFRVPVVLRIVDEAESLVFDAERIVGACEFAHAGANLAFGGIQDGEGHQGSDVGTLPAASLHEPEPHFLIEAVRCNYEGPVIGRLAIRFGENFGAVHVTGMHQLCVFELIATFL